MTDARERIRALEVLYEQGHQRLIDCFAVHRQHIEMQDKRLSTVEEAVAGHSVQVAQTPALQARVEAIEARWERIRNSGQYLAAAAVMSLVATGRMTVDQAHALIDLGARLLAPGLLPPGSGG